MYEHAHRVQFYETDLMQIMHHSNYLRAYEEARVAWGASQGLIRWGEPQTAMAFAVLKTEVVHLKPCRFGDQLKIELQIRMHRARIVFEYKMWNDSVLVSEARTQHVSVDGAMQLQRPSSELRQHLENEKWNETWLLNL